MQKALYVMADRNIKFLRNCKSFPELNLINIHSEHLVKIARKIKYDHVAVWIRKEYSLALSRVYKLEISRIFDKSKTTH